MSGMTIMSEDKVKECSFCTRKGLNCECLWSVISHKRDVEKKEMSVCWACLCKLRAEMDRRFEGTRHGWSNFRKFRYGAQK